MGLASLTIAEGAKQALLTAIRDHTLPHAYLFLGPAGVGKRTTALALAKALNCPVQQAEACNRCSTCQRIERSLHPDVHLVEPQGQAIKIDQIRHLQSLLSLHAYEGGTKVAILDDASRLTKEAANALLKVLEEPPALTLLILVCQHLGELPATVLSRTQMLRFGLLRHPTLVTLLRQQGRPQAEAELLASLSGGRPGKALTLEVPKVVHMRQQALDLLTRASSGDPAVTLASAEQWAKRKSDHDLLFEMLLSLARDLAVIRAGGCESHLIDADMASSLSPLATSLPRATVWEVFEIIHATHRALTHNANPQLAFEVMLFSIGDAYERARH
jgi:DNA polymerase-3 subunit delta'